MVATSQFNIIRDLVAILSPFKEATEETRGANYRTSSLVIPVKNLIRKRGTYKSVNEFRANYERFKKN